MFEYKKAEFFNDFFNNHEDFKILEEFKELTGQGEYQNEKQYIGKLKYLHSLHPLELLVEIPLEFPHKKLTFWTKSLFGYPHLIPDGKSERERGSWFCLNTPFAETAENQLVLEIQRLKEWVERQLNEELPAFITDINLRKALLIANGYEWENANEINEISKRAILTFLGEWYIDENKFKKKKGYLNCLKTPDNRFYAFENERDFTTFKFPFIIVDSYPVSDEILEDFLKLKEYYNWDEETTRFLLPKFNVHKPYHAFTSNHKEDIDENTALNLISKVRDELNKEEPNLTSESFIHRIKQSHNLPDLKTVPPSHKKIILEELDKIEQEVKQNNGIKGVRSFYDIPFDDPEYEKQAQEEDYYIEFGQYELTYFALACPKDNKLNWVLLSTNSNSYKYQQTSYDILVKDIHINKNTGQKLFFNITQCVTKKMFFGRGALSEIFSVKKIAVIGLGAIGSIVIDILAHGGAEYIGLWDTDIVEPGNICRSTYQLKTIGESKVIAAQNKILSINPFIKKENIKSNGYWLWLQPNDRKYVNGSFYGEINYNDQIEAIKALDEYDLIIDCSASNELLHFLSYAIPDKDIISLCITNHAYQLLCMTSTTGNPFELRKTYLSAIEQDTKNFYVEGIGCYSPTFLAKGCDIAALVNLCFKNINSQIGSDKKPVSSIIAYDDRGIINNALHRYKLSGENISLVIPNEILIDGEELPENCDGILGYILGRVSRDGNQIMVTHIIEPDGATNKLENIFNNSKGIIDYLGDFVYSGVSRDTYSDKSRENIKSKAMDEDININNPILAVRNPEGDISFYLYFNNQLLKFEKE